MRELTRIENVDGNATHITVTYTNGDKLHQIRDTRSGQLDTEWWETK